MFNWIKRKSAPCNEAVRVKKSKKFSLSAYGKKITMSFPSIKRLKKSVVSAIDEDNNKRYLNSIFEELKKPDTTDVTDNLGKSQEKEVNFSYCKNLKKILSLRKKETWSRRRKLSQGRFKRKFDTFHDSGWEDISSVTSSVSLSSLISDRSVVVIQSSSPLTEAVWFQESNSCDSNDEKNQGRQLLKLAPRKTMMMKRVYEKSRPWAKMLKDIIPSRRRNKRTSTTVTATTAKTTRERKKNKGNIVLPLDRIGLRAKKVSFSMDTKIYDCDVCLLGDRSETRDLNLTDEIYENDTIDVVNFDETSENPFNVTTESSVGTMLFGANLKHHRSLNDLYKLFREEKHATFTSNSKFHICEGTAKLLPGNSPVLAVKKRTFRVDCERNEGILSSPLSFLTDTHKYLPRISFNDVFINSNEKYQKISEDSDSKLFLEKIRTTTVFSDTLDISSDPNKVVADIGCSTGAFTQCESLEFQAHPISQFTTKLWKDEEGNNQHVNEFDNKGRKKS